MFGKKKLMKVIESQEELIICLINERKNEGLLHKAYSDDCEKIKACIKEGDYDKAFEGLDGIIKTSQSLADLKNEEYKKRNLL